MPNECYLLLFQLASVRNFKIIQLSSFLICVFIQWLIKKLAFLPLIFNQNDSCKKAENKVKEFTHSPVSQPRICSSVVPLISAVLDDHVKVSEPRCSVKRTGLGRADGGREWCHLQKLEKLGASSVCPGH